MFTAAGIDATYENARHSLLVKGLIAKQNEAVKAFGGARHPVVRSRQIQDRLNAGAVRTSVEGYAKEYAAVVRHLLIRGLKAIPLRRPMICDRGANPNSLY
ncbi:hypothetical protein M8494_21715 [Serratia ureilytica]